MTATVHRHVHEHSFINPIWKTPGYLYFRQLHFSLSLLSPSLSLPPSLSHSLSLSLPLLSVCLSLSVYKASQLLFVQDWVIIFESKSWQWETVTSTTYKGESRDGPVIFCSTLLTSVLVIRNVLVCFHCKFVNRLVALSCNKIWICTRKWFIIQSHLFFVWEFLHC